MGKAAQDYLKGIRGLNIKVRSNIAEDDVIPVDYLFRSFIEMPDLEQTALTLCRGKVLDIGAGVGSHTLYLQQKGLETDALDLSKGCYEVAKQRGVYHYYNTNFYTFKPETPYDTLLLMMNGIGLAGKLDNLTQFFAQLKKLIQPNGQVLLDSSDLRYLYIDEDSYVEVPEDEYYGEVTYTMHYKNQHTPAFPWLFIDPLLLAQEAKANGFRFEKIKDGSHYDYLARLTLKN